MLRLHKDIDPSNIKYVFVITFKSRTTNIVKYDW